MPNVDRIRDLLLERGKALLADRAFAPLPFSKIPEADALLKDLDRHPHGFVLACLMDRQTKAERAWVVPYEFGQRVGSVEIGAWAGLTEAKIHTVFREPSALHRLVDTMAETFYLGIQRIMTTYAGDASRIWKGTPSSAALVRRFLEFKGVGPKIATMAANILVREMKIPVSDKYSIDVSADVHVCRVFERLGLVQADASNEEIVYAAREMNPEYPGVFDLAAWEIGRDWCHPRLPDCGTCRMQPVCPTAPRLVE